MAHTGYGGYGGVCDKHCDRHWQLEDGVHLRFTYRRTDFRLFLYQHHFHSAVSLSRMFCVGVGTIRERIVTICPLGMALGPQKRPFFFYLY